MWLCTVGWRENCPWIWREYLYAFVFASLVHTAVVVGDLHKVHEASTLFGSEICHVVVNAIFHTGTINASAAFKLGYKLPWKPLPQPKLWVYSSLFKTTCWEATGNMIIYKSKIDFYFKINFYKNTCIFIKNFTPNPLKFRFFIFCYKYL